MTTPQNIDLKTLLQLRGKTQAWLARAVGSSEKSVSLWCRGIKPSAGKQSEIAATMELTEHEMAALGWATEQAGV